MRQGTSNPSTQASLTGDQIIGELIRLTTLLIPAAISPHGRWGPLFHLFLFGTLAVEQKPFPLWRPNTSRMYRRITNHPCPRGIVPLAATQWKRKRHPGQLFYGHTYTAPTPKEYLLQKLGLVISNAIAIHVRDAKQGQLVEPVHPEDEDLLPPQPLREDDAVTDTLPHEAAPCPVPLTYTPPHTLTPPHIGVNDSYAQRNHPSFQPTQGVAHAPLIPLIWPHGSILAPSIVALSH